MFFRACLPLNTNQPALYNIHCLLNKTIWSPSKIHSLINARKLVLPMLFPIAFVYVAAPRLELMPRQRVRVHIIQPLHKRDRFGVQPLHLLLLQ
jgi:hypothetical protein